MAIKETLTPLLPTSEKFEERFDPSTIGIEDSQPAEAHDEFNTADDIEHDEVFLDYALSSAELAHKRQQLAHVVHTLMMMETNVTHDDLDQLRPDGGGSMDIDDFFDGPQANATLRTAQAFRAERSALAGSNEQELDSLNKEKAQLEADIDALAQQLHDVEVVPEQVSEVKRIVVEGVTDNENGHVEVDVKFLPNQSSGVPEQSQEHQFAA